MWLTLPVALSAAGYLIFAAMHPRTQLWGGTRWRLDGPPEEIALTFDDGPSNETPRFLDALEELGVEATFFVCGANVERRPDVARAIVDAGHAIGNHTFTHPVLAFCTPGRVGREITTTQAAIGDATGKTAKLFRPPYGVRSPFLKSALPAAGLESVHWSVLGYDWNLDAAGVTRQVLKHVDGRGIVCLHDGNTTQPHADRAHTLAALKEIVPQLRDRGHRFVKLPGWDAGQ